MSSKHRAARFKPDVLFLPFFAFWDSSRPAAFCELLPKRAALLALAFSSQSFVLFCFFELVVRGQSGLFEKLLALLGVLIVFGRCVFLVRLLRANLEVNADDVVS